MELNGARVVITGASRGIGAACARELSSRGADVALVSRDRSALQSVADELTGQKQVLAGDLLDDSFREELVATILEIGPIDVLVNNAGIEISGSLVDQSASEISAVLRLNLEVPALLCRAVLPHMIGRGSGHIVNVSSLAMAVNAPGFATYGASKAGLSSFTESLRLELPGTGVHLTSVEIGETDTDMLHTMREVDHLDAMYRRYERLRLQRLLGAEEVAIGIRRAIESGRPHVRLPRRAMAIPMIVNGPRRLSNLIQRGIPNR